jgi:NAD(P)-dependent dehydrogenase (short-subunit alcohol dehydrogenase family)
MEQKVIITGAADSVGRVIAERFASQGAQVHICDVRADALEATLTANPGMRGTVADIASPEEVADVVRQAHAWMGSCDVLINNVGIGGPRAAIEDISDADWQRTLDVNLGGAFQFMKQLIPGMKRQGGGVIINFSTGSTRTRLPMRTAYVVSKSALESLTLNAARELGPHNVRCNAILPGMIANERMQSIVECIAQESGRTPREVEQDYLKYISLRTKIEPSELADMVLFLASPAARKITGELIAVSGNVEWET